MRTGLQNAGCSWKRASVRRLRLASACNGMKGFAKGFAKRRVLLEEGFSEEAADGLRERGHNVLHASVGGHARAVFGRGQIIRRDPQTGVLWGGSDPRADGQVLGW